MIYCVKCVNFLEAQEQARIYMKQLKAELSEVRRYRAIPVIVLKNSDELHFVPVGKTLENWCLGRTYKIIGDDKTYRSGHPFKEHHFEQK